LKLRNIQFIHALFEHYLPKAPTVGIAKKATPFSRCQRQRHALKAVARHGHTVNKYFSWLNNQMSKQTA
jgi:hypothetical protein